MSEHRKVIGRRALLGGLGAALTLTSPARAGWQAVVDLSPSAPEPVGESRLYIRCQRTKQVFDDVFRAGPLIYDDALAEIDHLMRDWRRDEVREIDRRLIDGLSALQSAIGFDEPLEMISGYRSPETNRMLRRRGAGAARKSLHVEGRAADIRVPGLPTSELSRRAKALDLGGVGTYAGRRFVHLDTGPKRSWRG